MHNKSKATDKSRLHRPCFQANRSSGRAVPFTGIDVTVSNRGPGKRVRTRRPLGSSIRKTRSLGRIWLRHAPIQANGHTDARLEVWQFLDAGFDPGER